MTRPVHIRYAGRLYRRADDFAQGLEMKRIPDDGKPSSPGTHGRYPVLMDSLSNAYLDNGSTVEWSDFEQRHMTAILELENELFPKVNRRSKPDDFAGVLLQYLEELGYHGDKLEKAEQDALALFIDNLLYEQEQQHDDGEPWD